MFRPIALALALAAPVAATADPASVRLLDGWRDGARHVVALEITLPSDWHTYWRVPGAGGIPPRIEWSGSSNLRAARIVWPHPEVFESFGMRTIGYRGGVVLPVLLTPEDPDAPIGLDLTLFFGVCRDICVPVEAAFGTALNLGESSAATRATIEAALARRASGADEAGVLDATCRLAAGEGRMEVAATVRLSDAPAAAPTAVIEAAGRPDLWIGEAEASTAGTTVTAAAPMEAAAPAGPFLDRRALRLTLIDPTAYVEIEGCRAPD